MIIIYNECICYKITRLSWEGKVMPKLVQYFKSRIFHIKFAFAALTWHTMKLTIKLFADCYIIHENAFTERYIFHFNQNANDSSKYFVKTITNYLLVLEGWLLAADVGCTTTDRRGQSPGNRGRKTGAGTSWENEQEMSHSRRDQSTGSCCYLTIYNIPILA